MNEGLVNIVALLSLVTFPSPTIVFEIPLTVPVNEGFAIGAFMLNSVATSVVPYINAVAFTVPFTCNFSPGEVSPMPTLPVPFWIDNR